MAQGRELLKRIMRETDAVPPMPHVIQKVMSLTQDPKSSSYELQSLIQLDQALTAAVLKLCNSAYYGLPRNIASVSQAVTYLGFRTIRNLVLSTFLSEVYAGTVAVVGLSSGGLWEHSVAAAVAAELLCKRLSRPGAGDVAFTCGLLHDVGKTILCKSAEDTQEAILHKMQEEGRPYVWAEREVLGFDHAVIGAKVVDGWNFPAPLVQAIGLHHDPAKARGDRFLTQVTHVANVLAINHGAGIDPQAMVASPLCEITLEQLDLSAPDLDALAAELEGAYQKAAAFLGKDEEEEPAE